MRRLLRSTRGAAALEFALVAPVLIFMMLGVFQTGLYYIANSGLKQAVDEGARAATMYVPATTNHRPADSTILAAITAAKFGFNSANATVTLTHGTASGGNYVDIQASYTIVSLGYGLPALTLMETRRAFQT